MTASTQFSEYAARLRCFMAQTLANGGPDETHHEQFNRLAMDLFALQFQRNASYRKLCDARKLSPANVSRWDGIPAVPAAAFKELELTSIPPAERTTTFHSSGTTSQTFSRHFHNAASLGLYEASLLPWFQKHLLPELSRAGEGVGVGADDGIEFLFLTPTAREVSHSSLVHMFETVLAKFGSARSMFCGTVERDGAWSLNQRAAGSFLVEASKARRPVAVLGTAFNFVHLLDGMAGDGRRIELPPGSWVLETGGYKGRSRTLAKSELHSLISERLGVPASCIVCEYGMSELASQAYDLALASSRLGPRAARLFHFPPWVRVRIISPETGREVCDGETGLLRIFDLANVRSVLAIQTEDLAIRRAGGFELLGRAVAAEPRGCSLMAVNSLESK